MWILAVGLHQDKQSVALIHYLGDIKSKRVHKIDVIKSHSRKQCRKHEGIMGFIFVSCISLRKVTISSLLHIDLMLSSATKFVSIVLYHILLLLMHQLLHLK